MWLEAPDIVWFHPRGEVSAEDMRLVNEYYEQHIRDWPRIFMIVDARSNGGISAEARKAAATLFDWVPFRGSVFIGASFAMRTVGKLLMLVIGKLSKRLGDNPLVYVSTEEEARAWVAERRRVLGQP